MIGPIPGTLIKRSQPASWRAKTSISLDRPSMRSSSRRQSPARSSSTRTMRGDKPSQDAARMRGNSARRKRQPCRTAMQEGADLIDDAGALTDQPLTHAVERLQVELLGGLGRDELHRRALHHLGDRLGVAEVVLLPPRVGPHIFGWHQPSVVAKRCEFAAQMVCANAGLHADETRRHGGKPGCYLATRPLLAQDDRATPIETHNVKRVLADIDTDHGDSSIERG